jgi:hypothetical protein
VSAFEPLRRPQVSYEALTQLTGGALEAAVDTDERLAAQVHAQLEVRASTPAIERAQEEIGARGGTRNSSCRPTSTTQL